MTAEDIKKEIIESCATPIMMADKQPLASTINEIIDITIYKMQEYANQEAQDKDVLYDMSAIPAKEKNDLVNGFVELTAKYALKLFTSLGLQTHIKANIVNDANGDKYTFSFIKELPKDNKS